MDRSGEFVKFCEKMMIFTLNWINGTNRKYFSK